MSRKKTTLVIATSNPDKLKEIAKMTSSLPVKLKSLKDFGSIQEVEENGKTFLQNAKKKAAAYSRHTKTLAMADDSGLMVPSLNNKPGVYSARYAFDGCTYDDNCKKLLHAMKRKKGLARRAVFVTEIAICQKGRFLASARGECKGKIACEQLGANGFGYDSVFIPNGYSKTFAQMSLAQKNKISHRSKALKKAKVILGSLLRGDRLTKRS